MPSYDERHVGDLRGTVAAVCGWPGVSERTTFGCPSFTVDGELFAVVSNQGVSITKLPETYRAELAETVPVAPFDAGGRRVEAWATVPPESAAPEVLAHYLRASYEAAVAAAED